MEQTIDLYKGDFLKYKHTCECEMWKVNLIQHGSASIQVNYQVKYEHPNILLLYLVNLLALSYV